MNTAVILIVALALLFFGRKLYWVFVAAVGFFAGMHFGADWFAGHPEWVVLLCALLVGAAGAILAIFFQRIAVGIAGFFAGGQLGLLLLRYFDYGEQSSATLIAFFVGGIFVAIIFILLLDWALIAVSSLLGAATIATLFEQSNSIELLIFLGLLACGILVQSMGMRGPVRQEV